MNRLQDMVIILTGGGGGIGQAIAARLASEGAWLMLAERDNTALENIAQNLPESDTCRHFTGDLSLPETAQNLVAETIAHFAKLDGLVNNAATLEMADADVTKTPLAAWQNTLTVNLTGPFLMCQAAVPELQKTKGAIVNMSSVVAHAGSAQSQIAYTTAKGGIEAMTREIAIAHARHGVRANCVAPGPVKTERTAHYFADAEKWQSRRQHIPMGRLGKTDEIAAVVAFLLSRDAGYVTGASYLADGGIAAAYLVDDDNGADRP